MVNIVQFAHLTLHCLLPTNQDRNCLFNFLFVFVISLLSVIDHFNTWSTLSISWATCCFQWSCTAWPPASSLLRMGSFDGVLRNLGHDWIVVSSIWMELRIRTTIFVCPQSKACLSVSYVNSNLLHIVAICLVLFKLWHKSFMSCIFLSCHQIQTLNYLALAFLETGTTIRILKMTE